MVCPRTSSAVHSRLRPAQKTPPTPCPTIIALTAVLEVDPTSPFSDVDKNPLPHPMERTHKALRKLALAGHIHNPSNPSEFKKTPAHHNRKKATRFPR